MSTMITKLIIKNQDSATVDLIKANDAGCRWVRVISGPKQVKPTYMLLLSLKIFGLVLGSILLLISTVSLCLWSFLSSFLHLMVYCSIHFLSNPNGILYPGLQQQFLFFEVLKVGHHKFQTCVWYSISILSPINSLLLNVGFINEPSFPKHLNYSLHFTHPTLTYFSLLDSYWYVIFSAQLLQLLRHALHFNTLVSKLFFQLFLCQISFFVPSNIMSSFFCFSFNRAEKQWSIITWLEDTTLHLTII